MNPRDFLDVAGEWAAGSGEAEWRSAVSRAYYAAHHVARRLLRQCGFMPPPVEQAHAYVWLRLANCGHRDVQQVGNDLNFLRRMRNWADYDLDQPFAHVLAIAQVQTAANIIQLLDFTATVPPVLATITDAIKEYERDVLRQVTWQG
jgi:hypothetical protein